MKYTAKYIQIKVGTEQRELVYEDENGNQIVGSDEECGLLLRKGEQLFDANGKEITLPEGIKKIDEYIGRDNDEHYEYFYATKENGAKTILEYEFKREGKNSPTREFCLINHYENAEIVPMQLKDTLFEEWVKYPKFSEQKTKLEDWVVIKFASFYKNIDYFYAFYNIKSRDCLDHFDYKTDAQMFKDLSIGEVRRWPDGFFTALPIFMTNEKGTKGMAVGDYVTSEVLLGYGWWPLFMTKE